MSKFPNVATALRGWKKTIILAKVTQVTQNYGVVNAEQLISFKGVVQPLSAEQLKVRPLEERSWKWSQIHTEKELSISTGDKIKYRNKAFKVMAKKDYSLNGYFEYHIVEAYE